GFRDIFVAGRCNDPRAAPRARHHRAQHVARELRQGQGPPRCSILLVQSAPPCARPQEPAFEPRSLARRSLLSKCVPPESTAAAARRSAPAWSVRQRCSAVASACASGSAAKTASHVPRPESRAARTVPDRRIFHILRNTPSAPSQKSGTQLTGVSLRRSFPVAVGSLFRPRIF